MLCEKNSEEAKNSALLVLILVLMEDALRVNIEYADEDAYLS